MIPPDAPPGLPILETVSAAYRSVFAHVVAPIRIALVPALIGFALFVLLSVSGSVGVGAPPQQGGTLDPLDLVLRLIALAGLIACSIAFASAWMRYLVASGPGDPAPIGFRFGAEEWAILGYGLLLGVFVLAITLPSGFLIAAIGGVSGDIARLLATAIVAAVVLYVIVRASLVFPAAASGATKAWSLAWRLSRGANAWRLLAAFVVIVLPFSLIAQGVLALIAAPALGIGSDEDLARALQQGDWLAPLALIVLGLIANFFATALQYAGLAQAYRNLTDPAGRTGRRPDSALDR